MLISALLKGNRYEKEAALQGSLSFTSFTEQAQYFLSRDYGTGSRRPCGPGSLP